MGRKVWKFLLKARQPCSLSNDPPAALKTFAIAVSESEQTKDYNSISANFPGGSQFLIPPAKHSVFISLQVNTHADADGGIGGRSFRVHKATQRLPALLVIIAARYSRQLYPFLRHDERSSQNASPIQSIRRRISSRREGRFPAEA